MFQDIKKIEQTYNLIAKEYSDSFLGEHDKKPKDQEILHRFATEIRTTTPVWDLGCGPGQTTKYLNDLGIKISGLDISEKIIEQAKLNYPNINFRKGNILELDFENNSIAAIVAFYAIVHFSKEQVEIFFSEIFRVLQLRGRFLFTYHIGNETIHIKEFLGKKADINFSFFNSDFINRSLTRAGFAKIEIIEREPYNKVEYESRRAYVFATK
ncbi:MAG: class I SAM-dependent methyltransferase [Spirochaetota bacterium]